MNFGLPDFAQAYACRCGGLRRLFATKAAICGHIWTTENDGLLKND